MGRDEEIGPRLQVAKVERDRGRHETLARTLWHALPLYPVL